MSGCVYSYKWCLNKYRELCFIVFGFCIEARALFARRTCVAYMELAMPKKELIN